MRHDQSEVLRILELAKDKAVLKYEPSYSDLPSPGPEPVQVDDEALAYCKSKKWIRIQHVRGNYERRINVFEPCDVTEMTLTPSGRCELYEMSNKQPEPPVDWQDFRNGPGGRLLTAEVCWDRFRVSNSVLSKEAKKDPSGLSGLNFRVDVF